jgi:hypothetical protein
MYDVAAQCADALLMGDHPLSQPVSLMERGGHDAGHNDNQHTDQGDSNVAAFTQKSSG